MDYQHDRTVCIIGLGYVGLTLAIIMAEAGYTVWGVEINQDFTDKIVTGKAHFLSPVWTNGSGISFRPDGCWW